jgi:ABC-type sugar transport system ATPase subunit
VELDPKTLVRDLSFSSRQLVEIAKALSYDGKVLILDEPTSALTTQETGILLVRTVNPVLMRKSLWVGIHH